MVDAITYAISVKKAKEYAASILHAFAVFKGSCPSASLPSSPAQGDVWCVTDGFVISGVTYPPGTHVGWNGSAWCALPHQAFVVEDSLTSESVGLALSAKQGKALKGLIDYKSHIDVQIPTSITSGLEIASVVNETGSGTTSTGIKVPVDSALSDTSENPVQNKAVKAAMGAKVDASASMAAGSSQILNSEGNAGATLYVARADNSEVAAVTTNIASGEAVMVQLYDKKTADNKGARIALTKDGAYYTNQKADGSFDSNDEIATKKDITGGGGGAVTVKVLDYYEDPIGEGENYYDDTRLFDAVKAAVAGGKDLYLLNGPNDQFRLTGHMKYEKEEQSQETFAFQYAVPEIQHTEEGEPYFTYSNIVQINIGVYEEIPGKSVATRFQLPTNLNSTKQDALPDWWEKPGCVLTVDSDSRELTWGPSASPIEVWECERHGHFLNGDKNYDAHEFNDYIQDSGLSKPIAVWNSENGLYYMLSAIDSVKGGNGAIFTAARVTSEEANTQFMEILAVTDVPEEDMPIFESASVQPKLTAGTNVTIDETDPFSPVISAEGGTTIEAGRKIGKWNCMSGLASYIPSTPFAYSEGDYFVVETISGTGTNLRPYGTSYTGVASTAAETATVSPGGFYVYENAKWGYYATKSWIVNFRDIAGEPDDNWMLKRDLSAIRSNVSTAQGDITTLQSSVTTLGTSVGNLDTAVGNLQTSVGNLDTAVGNLQTSVGNLDTAVGELKSGKQKKVLYGSGDPPTPTTEMADGDLYFKLTS